MATKKELKQAEDSIIKNFKEIRTILTETVENIHSDLPDHLNGKEVIAILDNVLKRWTKLYGSDEAADMIRGLRQAIPSMTNKKQVDLKMLNEMYEALKDPVVAGEKIKKELE